MAALQSIRSRSGLLVGFLGVALLAFVLGDFFSSGSTLFNKMRDNAFSVDGEVVPTAEYAKRIEEWETFRKAISRNPIDETTRANMREEVYQQMVKEMMLDKQAEKLGLTVTPEELEDMVYGANPAPLLTRIPFFANPQTGQFDPAMVRYFLQVINQDITKVPAEQYDQVAEILSAKSMWLTIENLLKYNRLEEKYASLVAGTVLVTDLEKKQYTTDESKLADIAYIMKPYSSLSDSVVTVTDTEVKALYEKRKKNFKLDTDLRKVSYFVKDVIPSEEDYAAIEKEMEAGAERLRTTANPALVVNDFPGNQYVDAYIATAKLPGQLKEFVNSSKEGEVFGPAREGQDYVMYKLVGKTVGADSVQLKMIMFPNEFDVVAVNHLADSLMTEIKKGKKFEDVANELMPGSNGGDIGMVDEMSLVRSGIPAECITGNIGSIVKVALGGQTRLVKIAAKSKPVAKAKLAMVQMGVIISDKTQNSIDQELTQFVNQYGNLENFSEAALKDGYSLADKVVLHPATIALEETVGTRPVIQWAFNNEIGSVKKFDLQDKRVVAIIDSEIKGSYVPFEEVEKGLKAEILRDKKAEKIITDLKTKNITTLDDYAKECESSVGEAKFVSFLTYNISGVGQEPIFNVYSKVGDVNKISAPLQGQEGVYILNVTSKSDNSDSIGEDMIKGRLTQNNNYQLMQSATFVLQEKMDVKDNRVKFW